MRHYQSDETIHPSLLTEYPQLETTFFGSNKNLCEEVLSIKLKHDRVQTLIFEYAGQPDLEVYEFECKVLISIPNYDKDIKIVFDIENEINDSDNLMTRNRIMNRIFDGFIWTYSLKLVDIIGHIGGLLPKAAQILSLRQDLIPCTKLRTALKSMQDNCVSRTDDIVMTEMEKIDKNFWTKFHFKKTLKTGSVGQACLISDEFHENDYILKVNFNGTLTQFKSQWTIIQSIAETKIVTILTDLWRFISDQEGSIFDEFHFR